jgi:hypothetical protein
VENKRPGIIIDPRVENWTTATYEEGIASAEVWLGEKQLKMSEGEFYMGENTIDRQIFISRHLRSAQELEDVNI